jgi:uncharacterized repeat protein (TIGR03803 family)
VKTTFPKQRAFLLLATAIALSSIVRANAQSFTNLHSLVFTNGTGPVAALTLSGTTLYGTTRIYGGGNAGGYGSAFKMGTDGSNFSVLHIFSGDTDGGNLNGNLLLANGTLYGTATFGGASNHGCIFAISINGTGLTNLYNFSAAAQGVPSTNSDGAYPAGGLVLSGNTLYGMANGGGIVGWGNVFALKTNGSGFTNLHNFNNTDGENPWASLILSGTTLYGTTPAGGSVHCGNIFSISTNGTDITTLHEFTQPSVGAPRTNSDGAFPPSSLSLSGNTLYGTTPDGGDAGNGVIYKINIDGSDFTVLHSFSATTGPLLANGDGAKPKAELIVSGGILYGTAENGGSFGNGTVFQLTTNGTGFTTLHSFTATNGVTGTNTDGAHPVGGLILSGTTLYGTARNGGTAAYGTIFSLQFPPVLGIQRSGADVILTWLTNFTGFNLQTATNLAPPVNWSVLSGQYSVTYPASDKQRFFRLTHP